MTSKSQTVRTGSIPAHNTQPPQSTHIAPHNQQRSYHSTPPLTTIYPPQAPPSTSENVWVPHPPPNLTHWSDHTLPAPHAPNRTLPPIPTSPISPREPDAPPLSAIISRLKRTLIGGRHPLSKTWEKASFIEECQSAPATITSTPISPRDPNTGMEVLDGGDMRRIGGRDLESGLAGQGGKKSVVGRSRISGDNDNGAFSYVYLSSSIT